METKLITFEDEKVLNYCNLIGTTYNEEVPIQYLMGALNNFEPIKKLKTPNKQCKQIQSHFQQNERIMTLESYKLELECVKREKKENHEYHTFQLKLINKEKQVGQIDIKYATLV